MNEEAAAYQAAVQALVAAGFFVERKISCRVSNDLFILGGNLRYRFTIKLIGVRKTIDIKVYPTGLSNGVAYFRVVY